MILKWTRTPPTEAGWYWYRRDGYGYGFCAMSPFMGVVEVKSDWIGTWGGEFERQNNGMWSGPIPPPEEAS